MATLTRDRDGEGYYGSRVEAHDPKKGMKIVGHKPIVGCCLLVGTVGAGMFTSRDWWMTTPIEEILSESDEEIRFRTKNSTYTLRK